MINRELAERIPGGVKWGTNGEGQIRCPFHDDKNPSCSINTEKNTFICHACGEKGTLSFLLARCGIEAPKQSHSEIAYDYTDEAGKLVYQVVRIDTDTGKDFYQRRPDDAGDWITKGAMKDVKRLPYRLPELLKGLAAGELILIVEGEKCVDALHLWGYTATCNSGGAGKWRPELNRHFPRDAKICLIPDADKPGQAHMQQIGKALLARGCRMFWVDLGFPIEEKHGKDIANWIPNHSKDDFDAKTIFAPAFEPAEEEPEEEKEDRAADPGELVKDYGHAAILAKHFTERVRWAPHRGRWMRWTGKVWEEEEEERVAKVSSDKLRKEYAEQIGLSADKATLVRLMALVRDTCVYSKIIAALSFLKGWEKILTRTAEWDRHPWLLNVGNGILDLKTGSLGGHDPAILLTKLAPTDFDPDAEGPTWQAHLERFLPNENIRRQVQRDLGLALVGTTIDEILPIWYGLGGNGKSTTTLVLRNVLENYTSEAAPNLLVLQKFEKHPTEIAELSGRRIIFSSEIGQGKRLDEQRVKELTGGGQPKRAHFMRQDNFDVEQTFTIFMLVNYHPVITGTDHAIWRRVRLIPWTVQISEAEKLPQDEIVKRLSAEGPAILAWLVAGLMDWQKDRNWIAPEVKAATTAFRAEQDRLGAFIEDTCEEAPHYTVPVGELYEKYTTWCSEVGEEALGKTAFGNRLKGGGKAAKRTGHENVWTWFGLRLKRELRLGATQSTNSPLELELVGGEQVKKVAESRKDLQFVDTEALKANAEKLAKYLNDDTIPLEMRNKRSGEYTVLVDEIAAREKVEK